MIEITLKIQREKGIVDFNDPDIAQALMSIKIS